MIFQPSIIALLLASVVCLCALAIATPFALDLIRGWDIRSGSERQLTLERRTYVFSTLMTFVLWTQIAALLLFIFNADRMSVQFAGAMCAVGSLNVNPFGFPTLASQVLVFFFATGWLAINHADNLAPDYPLTRVKYGLLFALLPLLAAAFLLQLNYFLGLEADVITSCCGSLFSREARTVPGELSALPVAPAMVLFYGATAAACLAAGRQAITRRGAWLTAATGIVAFAAGVAGIVSFVSLYVYEHPHHHCPFCLLKPEYGYQGYWLYVPLFGAAAASLCAGILQPSARLPSLRERVPALGARLAGFAAVGFALFGIAATLMILRSRLILIGG